MNRWLFPLAFVLLSLLGAQAFATTVAAKKDGTAVLKEARKDSPVIKELKAGEALEVDSRTGMYWKVKLADGSQAYVSVMSVQHLANEDNGLQTALRNQALEARKKASEEDNSRVRSAVMGVRGLSESQELSSAGQLRPDTSAVYRMEDRTIENRRIDGLENLVQEEIENTWKARQEKQ